MHEEQQIPHRLNRLLKKSKKQIPRGLKPTRDDKHKELNGAPKGAPLSNTPLKPTFPAALRPTKDPLCGPFLGRRPARR
jgi:hypothetical protein